MPIKFIILSAIFFQVSCDAKWHFSIRLGGQNSANKISLAKASGCGLPHAAGVSVGPGKKQKVLELARGAFEPTERPGVDFCLPEEEAKKKAGLTKADCDDCLSVVSDMCSILGKQRRSLILEKCCFGADEFSETTRGAPGGIGLSFPLLEFFAVFSRASFASKSGSKIPQVEDKITKMFSDAVCMLSEKNPQIELSPMSKVKIIGQPGRARIFYVKPVYATYKGRKFKVLYGSGNKRDGATAEEFSKELFVNAELCHRCVVDRYLGGFEEDFPALCKTILAERKTVEAEDSLRAAKEACEKLQEVSQDEEDFVESKSDKMLFGCSMGYSNFLAEAGKKFGLYYGADAFVDISTLFGEEKNMLEIAQNSVGIAPFVGIVSVGNWMTYAICGVKLSFKNMKFHDEIQKKTKIECEFGVGSDYVLSEHFSIGLKYLKTPGSSEKMKYNDAHYDFQTNSSKVVVNLSYIW